MSVLFPDNPGTSLGAADLDRLPLDTDNASAWLSGMLPANEFFEGETHTLIRGMCRQALTVGVAGTSIRYWDLAILLPNVLFLLFLLCKIGPVVRKLRQSKSPVFKAFFLLVYITTLVNIARCLVSMSVSATDMVGEYVDKILWIFLKFFFITAELCVLMFGLLFGHLDSGTSIRRALLATVCIGLAHSTLQAVIELRLIDKNVVNESFFDLHTHGGIAFWLLTSALFTLIYLIVLLLPLTCIRKYVTLPSKCSFYVYCLLLSLLNAVQFAGAALIFFGSEDGMCFIDVSTYAYFCLYTPIVYFTLLRRSINYPSSSSPSSGLFSYRQQKDERGSGELPDTYYPRFSGLTSPSYDDLFDVARPDHRFTDLDREVREPAYPYPFDTPLMLASSETAESTVTTHSGSERSSLPRHSWRNSGVGSVSEHSGPRQLRGLGPSGTLVFEEQTQNKWHY